MKIYKYHSININLLQSIRKQENWYSKLSLLNDPYECFFFDNTNSSVYREFLSTLAVCCFSKNRNEILMWSNYASNHTGVCLEFEVVGDEILKGRLMDVDYDNEPLSLDTVERTHTGHLSLHISKNGRFLKTKFKNWSYEQEKRCYAFCDSDKMSGIAQPFLGPLTGVYFGKNASIDDIELVKHNSIQLSKVKFFQVELDTSTMKMDKLISL